MSTHCPVGNLVNGLSRTLREANRYLALKLNKAGLTALVPSHGDILLQLFAQEAISMQQLAETIGRDPSTVTALVKKLIDAGYVQTQKKACDRRITEVLLTDKGRALCDRVDDISRALNRVQAHNISAEDLATTEHTLTLIRTNFTQAIEQEMEGN